jgi:hypothetical protein
MNYRGITAAMVTNARLPRKPTLKKMVNGFFSNGEEEGETLQRSLFHC